VHGESDFVPGLVIDRFGSHFVIRAYSSGIELRLGDVVSALREVLPVESVFADNDFHLRAAEGLTAYRRLLLGNVPDSITIAESGVRYSVDIRNGQKTGFYFDQRLARQRVRKLSRGRSVLDVFCYSGGSR